MIRLTDVTKEYDQAGSSSPNLLVATNHLSLHIPKGEIFGLIGPNGAGKTTTLKMVCGLLAPTAGKITVNDIDVQQHPTGAQQYIGYLADFFSVYGNLKVWEYVDHFARCYKIQSDLLHPRVRHAISQVGLDSKTNAMVDGLSRGMKQRLGIARAIVHDPPLLILDEPASGLDPKARVELKDLLRQLHREGKTIFITSHVLSDLQEMCTSVAIMEKGNLLRVGKIADVLRSAGAARSIHIRLASPGFDLRTWLHSHDLPGAAALDPASVEFPFSGSDADLASLIRELVQAGAPVCYVTEKSDSLESLFSKLSSGEVM
ncbi:MAG TPA: ABC transporter ATP-binding protein [Dongiaceae bacterium]|nr:ABC transporter ATP-binding protein [Dongiaceae bacterium]